MPTTYSTNLKLSLMATGEQSGTWGDITNTNLGTLIEQAIVGAATVAMADANQTLSLLDGTTSNGRCVFITCTGALTANRNLTVPTVNKNYIIENATTGGFSIVAKTSAGSGITIAAGTKRFVYADGTNVVEAINAFGTVNNVTITTPASGATLTLGSGKTVAVSNSLTFTGTDGTSFAFPSSSGTVLTDGTIGTYLPPGVIFPYVATTAPSGYLLCNGQAVSRATYAALFAVIGTSYGAGDGSTTFNVPDVRGRVIAGSDSMGTSAASRLTATTMSPDGTSLASTGGAQTEQASVTSTGSTSGSLSVSVTSSSMDSPNTVTTSSPGVGQNHAGPTHTHANVVSSGATSGSLSVSVSGTTAAATNVQPTIIAYYIIKT